MPFIAVLLVVIVAAILAPGPAPLRAGAQVATPSTGSNSFVGAWRLTTITPFGPSQSLITFTSDGTVIFSDRPSLPGDVGFPVSFISAAHGAWEATGPDTASATFVEFVTDGEGNFLVIVTDSIEVTLSADGDTFSGQFSSVSTDPAGNVLYVGGGTVEATRITVQPLATPLATPAN
jgi:hypothetical protein